MAHDNDFPLNHPRIDDDGTIYIKLTDDGSITYHPYKLGTFILVAIHSHLQEKIQGEMCHDIKSCMDELISLGYTFHNFNEILMGVLANWISLSLGIGKYSSLVFVNVACSDAIWMSDDGELFVDFSIEERYFIDPVRIRVPPELLRRLKMAFDNNRKTVLTYISIGR